MSEDKKISDVEEEKKSDEEKTSETESEKDFLFTWLLLLFGLSPVFGTEQLQTLLFGVS